MGVGDEKGAGFLLSAVLLSLMLLSAEYCLTATSLTVADYSSSTTTATTSHLRNATTAVLYHDHEVKVEWLTADDMMLDFFKHSHHARKLQPAPEPAKNPPEFVTQSALSAEGNINCGSGKSKSQCLGTAPPDCHPIAACRSSG